MGLSGENGLSGCREWRVEDTSHVYIRMVAGECPTEAIDQRPHWFTDGIEDLLAARAGLVHVAPRRTRVRNCRRPVATAPAQGRVRFDNRGNMRRGLLLLVALLPAPSAPSARAPRTHPSAALAAPPTAIANINT